MELAAFTPWAFPSFASQFTSRPGLLQFLTEEDQGGFGLLSLY